MTTFAVTYRYVDDESRLGPLRPARMAFFRELERAGVLHGSGQLVGEGMPQGLLVLTVGDADEARRLLDDDPFAQAGLVTERLIGRWQTSLGVASR